MKKIITSTIIIAFMFLFSLPASAAIIDGIDDSSMASSVGSWLINVLLRNNNSATINNNVISSSNSGGNAFVSADDQSTTSISTGGATAVILVDNAANNNLVSETYESADGSDNDISDVNDESTASAVTSDVLDNDIENNNGVEVNNNIDAMADTGMNTVTSGDSLEGASMSTGIADTATGVSNMFNINIKEIFRTIRQRVI